MNPNHKVHHSAMDSDFIMAKIFVGRNRSMNEGDSYDHHNHKIIDIPPSGPGIFSFQHFSVPMSLKSIHLSSGSDCKCRFHYLHLYLNIAYLCLVSPLRPKMINEGEHYKLIKNKFQQILLGAAWILVVFRQLVKIRTIWHWQLVNHFVHATLFYFYLAHTVLHLILTVIFYGSLFLRSKRQAVESLLEKLSHSYLLSHSADKRHKGWIGVIALHIFFPIMAFLSTAVGYSVIDSWCWTPSYLFAAYVPRARYAFFVGNITHFRSFPDLANLSRTDVFLTSFYIAINAIYDLHLYLMSLLFGICMLTLWMAANRFQNLIKALDKAGVFQKDVKKGRELILYLYYDLKDISNGLNEVWGVFCFCYVVDIIPYHATDLDDGFKAQDWFDALKMFRSLIFFGWNLLLSAETFRKAQWFSTWLLEFRNRELFTDAEELKLLVQELRMEPIGMGAAGFYQINYAFVGQICATIITFFIITLQYKVQIQTEEC